MKKTRKKMSKQIVDTVYQIRNAVYEKGQMLVELILVMGLFALLIPALSEGFLSTRDGKAQQSQRINAVAFLQEAKEAVRVIRESGWVNVSTDGMYHPAVSGSTWSLVSGTETIAGLTRSITISSVQRNASGAIVTTGGSVDPSTKKVDVIVSWTQPRSSSITASLYLTRYLDNGAFIQTTQAEFDTGTKTNTATTNTSGGEVQMSNNNKAKWCSPAFSSGTIDLPDGPPVAVSATASASVNNPNDVVAVVAPFATTSAKMAHVRVTANTDPPSSTLRGTFTLDASKYSDAGYVPSGIDLTNSFKTNDVQTYTSSSGKKYALIATDLPDHEVVAVLYDDGNAANDTDASGEFADPVSKIYKYWTFFNTTIYSATDTGMRSPSANSVDTGGDGNGFESNPTRAYSINNSFAVDTNSGSGTGTSCTGSDKDRHRYYNYSLSIPSGAAIQGVEVRLDSKADSSTGNPQHCVQLSWDGGSNWTTAKTTSTLATGTSTFTLGGSADTWGRSWSDTQFSNANFRVRVINVASNISRDFSLDYVGVKVSYSGGTSPTNDQSPFGYGATSLTVMQDKGYVASGGYLYVMDLSNIDSKSPTNGLDVVGCRIEVDGYECKPADGTDRKYASGETGTSWSDTTTPAHASTCADGGNIELYATNDVFPVYSGGRTYIYAAVGAGTNPEFDIVDATDVPNSSSSPAVSSSSCGRSSGGNSGWKKVGSFDFNTASGTEEAANSVFAKSDGTRAYVSSNGGADSKQFYILNTTTKTAPTFLSGANNGTGPATGYYNAAGADGEMYPRRSMTVLNGQRVVLVGKDGITNGTDAQEYQVLNSETEATPTYCGGLNFDQGFNDLTSVSEADYDNFVYMVANTNLNELKIIQGGPDGTYNANGTFESPTFDPGFNATFNRFFSTTTIPALTNVQYQFATADPISGSCSGVSFNFLGPDGTASTYYTPSGSPVLLDDDGSGYENPGRCFRYKAFFDSTDQNQTAVIQDMTVNYSP
ncbi:MAG: hypothetical protein WBB49_01835 [Microgenomates group bacterium]|jgi:hypothetical protein|nr:MAG: hypothetical protein IPH70_00135 [Candidatus Roizmanbacteria bacterium]